MTDTLVKEQPRLADYAVQGAGQLPAVAQDKPPAPRARPEPKVFPAKIAASIIKITKEIGRIQKEGTNDFQKYKYTRWEDICEKLSPLLVDHGIVIVQSEQNRHLLEENDKGSVLAIVYHFTLVNEHGEQWPPVEWTSIARLRDQKGVTDDKAAAKCHTQAEKQFCIKQFKIRTDDYSEDDNPGTLPKKDARDLYKRMEGEIDDARSEVELQTWGKTNSDRLHTLPADWQDILRARYKAKLSEFKGEPTVEWTDEETGEITDPPREQPSVAAAPAPSSAPEAPPGAGAPSDLLAHWDAQLATAATISPAVLEACWSNVPADLKPTLKAAYERRHKPAATKRGKP